MSFTQAVRALDEEEERRRQAAEGRLDPVSELRRRFQWLAPEQPGMVGMPRQFNVGPVPIPNPLTVPGDILGSAGTLLNVAQDTVFKPMLDVPSVGFRAALTPVAMATRAAAGATQNVPVLGGYLGGAAEYLGRDPTAEEVFNPYAAGHYMDESLKSDWVRSLAREVVTDPTNLIPGIGFVGNAARLGLRGAAAARAAGAAGEALTLGQRLALRAEPLATRALAADEAASAGIQAAARQVTGPVAAGASAARAGLEAGLPSAQAQLRRIPNVGDQAARVLGTTAQAGSRGLEAGLRLAPIGQATARVNEILSAAEDWRGREFAKTDTATAEQIKKMTPEQLDAYQRARAAPFDRRMFGVNELETMTSEVWRGVADRWTLIHNRITEMPDSVRLVASLDALEQLLAKRQNIEALASKQRDVIYSRMTPEGAAAAGEMQLTEQEVDKLVRHNLASQGAQISALQDAALGTLDTLAKAPLAELNLVGDWSMTPQQLDALRKEITGTVNRVEEIGIQASQTAQQIRGFYDPVKEVWTPGIHAPGSQAERDAIDDMYRMNREEALGGVGRRMEALADRFTTPEQAEDIARVGQQTSDALGAAYSEIEDQLQPFEKVLEGLSGRAQWTFNPNRAEGRANQQLFEEAKRNLVMKRNRVKRLAGEEFVNAYRRGEYLPDGTEVRARLSPADAIRAANRDLQSQESILEAFDRLNVPQDSDVRKKVSETFAGVKRNKDMFDPRDSLDLLGEELLRVGYRQASPTAKYEPWLSPVLTALGAWRENALISVGYNVSNLLGTIAYTTMKGEDPDPIIKMAWQNLSDYLHSGGLEGSLMRGEVWSPSYSPEQFDLFGRMYGTDARGGQILDPRLASTMGGGADIGDFGRPISSRRGINRPSETATGRIHPALRAGVGAALGATGALTLDDEDNPLFAVTMGAIGGAAGLHMNKFAALNKSIATASEGALRPAIYIVRGNELAPRAAAEMSGKIRSVLEANAAQETAGRAMNNPAYLPGMQRVTSLADIVALRRMMREGTITGPTMGAPTGPVGDTTRLWETTPIDRPITEAQPGPREPLPPGGTAPQPDVPPTRPTPPTFGIGAEAVEAPGPRVPGAPQTMAEQLAEIREDRTWLRAQQRRALPAQQALIGNYIKQLDDAERAVRAGAPQPPPAAPGAPPAPGVPPGQTTLPFPDTRAQRQARMAELEAELAALPEEAVPATTPAAAAAPEDPRIARLEDQYDDLSDEFDGLDDPDSKKAQSIATKMEAIEDEIAQLREAAPEGATPEVGTPEAPPTAAPPERMPFNELADWPRPGEYRRAWENVQDLGLVKEIERLLGAGLSPTVIGQRLKALHPGLEDPRVAVNVTMAQLNIPHPNEIASFERWRVAYIARRGREIETELGTFAAPKSTKPAPTGPFIYPHEDVSTRAAQELSDHAVAFARKKPGAKLTPTEEAVLARIPDNGLRLVGGGGAFILSRSKEFIYRLTANERKALYSMVERGEVRVEQRFPRDLGGARTEYLAKRGTTSPEVVMGPQEEARGGAGLPPLGSTVTTSAGRSITIPDDLAADLRSFDGPAGVDKLQDKVRLLERMKVLDQVEKMTLEGKLGTEILNAVITPAMRGRTSDAVGDLTDAVRDVRRMFLRIDQAERTAAKAAPAAAAAKEMTWEEAFNQGTTAAEADREFQRLKAEHDRLADQWQAALKTDPKADATRGLLEARERAWDAGMARAGKVREAEMRRLGFDPSARGRSATAAIPDLEPRGGGTNLTNRVIEPLTEAEARIVREHDLARGYGVLTRVQRKERAGVLAAAEKAEAAGKKRGFRSVNVRSAEEMDAEIVEMDAVMARLKDQYDAIRERRNLEPDSADWLAMVGPLSSRVVGREHGAFLKRQAYIAKLKNVPPPDHGLMVRMRDEPIPDFKAPAPEAAPAAGAGADLAQNLIRQEWATARRLDLVDTIQKGNMAALNLALEQRRVTVSEMSWDDYTRAKGTAAAMPENQARRNLFDAVKNQPEPPPVSAAPPSRRSAIEAELADLREREAMADEPARPERPEVGEPRDIADRQAAEQAMRDARAALDDWLMAHRDALSIDERMANFAARGGTLEPLTAEQIAVLPKKTAAEYEALVEALEEAMNALGSPTRRADFRSANRLAEDLPPAPPPSPPGGFPPDEPPSYGRRTVGSEPGARAWRTGDLAARLKRDFDAVGGGMSPGEFRERAIKLGANGKQADALFAMWTEVRDRVAGTPAVEATIDVNLDYSQVNNITEFVRRSNIAPFITWSQKMLPKYAALLLQHPQYIVAADHLNNLSEEDIEESGLTGRWKALARQGQLGAMIADQAVGREGTLMAQPWRMLFPQADLLKAEPNENQGLLDQVLNALSPLGFSPGPVVTVPAEMLGIIGDRPFNLLRTSSYLDAIGSGILGRPYEFERVRGVAERGIRQAVGVNDQTSLTGQHPATEWAIRNRIAEIAFEETGGPPKGVYVTAMDDPQSAIWKRAAGEVARQHTFETITSSLAPVRPKFLSKTEEAIRAREMAQGVSPPQMEQMRARPVTDAERATAQANTRQYPLRAGESLDDRAVYLRTKAARDLAAKRDPAAETFRYVSGSEGTNISRGYAALDAFKKASRGMASSERQRLVAQLMETNPDFARAYIASIAAGR